MTKFDRYRFHLSFAGLGGGKLTLVTNGSTTDQGSSYSKCNSHAQTKTRLSISRIIFRTGQPKHAALQRHARLQHAKGNSRTTKKPMLTTDIQLRNRVQEWAKGASFKRGTLHGASVEGLWARLLVLEVVVRGSFAGEPTSAVHRYLV